MQNQDELTRVMGKGQRAPRENGNKCSIPVLCTARSGAHPAAVAASLLAKHLDGGAQSAAGGARPGLGGGRLTAPDTEAANTLVADGHRPFAPTAPKARAILDAGLEGALAILEHPEGERTGLRTSRAPERGDSRPRTRPAHGSAPGLAAAACGGGAPGGPPAVGDRAVLTEPDKRPGALAGREPWGRRVAGSQSPSTRGTDALGPLGYCTRGDRPRR